MGRRIGTIIRETLAAWQIKSHGCSACNEVMTEMNRVGVDKVEQNLEYFKKRMSDSIRQWRRENHSRIPQPPLYVIELLIRYAVAKAHQED